MTKRATESKAAEPSRVAGARGFRAALVVLERAAWVPAKVALAALRHTLLVDLVEKLADVAFATGIHEPVPTDFAFIQGIKLGFGRIFASTLCALLL